MNIGDVSFTARTTPGPGCIVADGSAVSRTAYAGLFAAIGTTYGVGDGETTFNVPDCRGRFLAAANIGSARLKNSRTGGVDADAIGNTGGEETHLLTADEIANCSLLGGTDVPNTGGTLSSESRSNADEEAHNNIPPCIVLLPIIYTGV